MSSKQIQTFCSVTGCNTLQAKKFLEIANGDVNNAVMFFFESGEEPQPEPHQPPQVLPQPPKQPSPEPQKPKETEKPHSIFRRSTQPSQKEQKQSSNFEHFQPHNTSSEQMVNDGGAREGGSATATYRPNNNGDAFEVKIDMYTNGILLNGHFFSYDDPRTQEYQKYIQSGQLPIQLFDNFPPSQRLQPNQQIKCSGIQQHQTEFDVAQQEKEQTQQAQ